MSQKDINEEIESITTSISNVIINPVEIALLKCRYLKGGKTMKLFFFNIYNILKNT